METTIVYGDYIGIMEKKMETTIMSYMGHKYCGVIFISPDRQLQPPKASVINCKRY